MKTCAWCRRPLPPGQRADVCDAVCGHVYAHDDHGDECVACDVLMEERRNHAGPFEPVAHRELGEISIVVSRDCETCGGAGMLGRVDPVYGDVVGPWRECEDCWHGTVKETVPVCPAAQAEMVAA